MPPYHADPRIVSGKLSRKPWKANAAPRASKPRRLSRNTVRPFKIRFLTRTTRTDSLPTATTTKKKRTNAIPAAHSFRNKVRKRNRTNRHPSAIKTEPTKVFDISAMIGRAPRNCHTGPVIGVAGRSPSQAGTYHPHIGDSGRNQFYGAHYTNADMVVMKNIRFIERYQMEIRSEFFNIFNHPQFGQPGNVIENPGTFGLSPRVFTQPNETTSPRRFHLLLKLF